MSLTFFLFKKMFLLLNLSGCAAGYRRPTVMHVLKALHTSRGRRHKTERHGRHVHEDYIMPNSLPTFRHAWNLFPPLPFFSVGLHIPITFSLSALSLSLLDKSRLVPRSVKTLAGLCESVLKCVVISFCSLLLTSIEQVTHKFRLRQ